MRLVTAVALALTLSASSASAQDLQAKPTDYSEQMWFVPYLGGAVSFEGGLLQPLRLGTSSGFPTTWFAGAGYKHYFEGHGRQQLRLMATYEHGGILNPAVEGTANRVGASAAFTLRGVSPQWYFGQISALVDVGYLTLRPGSAPFNAPLDVQTGFEVGFGVETTFGSMFVLDPYLMGETGAQITLNRVSIGSVDTWEIWGRWVVRFDIGIRDASRAPSPSPTWSAR